MKVSCIIASSRREKLERVRERKMTQKRQREILLHKSLHRNAPYSKSRDSMFVVIPWPDDNVGDLIVKSVFCR